MSRKGIYILPLPGHSGLGISNMRDDTCVSSKSFTSMREENNHVMNTGIRACPTCIINKNHHYNNKLTDFSSFNKLTSIGLSRNRTTIKIF